MQAKQQPIVSITIPTYNRGYLLKPSLNALFKQIDEEGLHNLVEVVISDNASTDNTKEIVSEFINKNKYLIVYNQNTENLGVIKNILKLVEFSTAKYWMFYGDDDVIPAGALKTLVEEFKTNTYSAFMFKWPAEADEYCTDLVKDQEFSYETLAKNYFYYIGNAGIFAVETDKAKQVVKEHKHDLIDTCWPQTLIVFIAIALSENKNIKFKNIVSSVPPSDVIVVSNGYYLFETTIYALLRTALSIEKITKKNFVNIAINSIYGIQHFDSLKQVILERYCFYDLPKQKNDLEASVKKAVNEIPAKYKTEINYINKYISKPGLFLYMKFYTSYFKAVKFNKLKTSFLNKIKIASPLGFNAIINQQVEAFNSAKLKAKRTEVDSNSGYF